MVAKVSSDLGLDLHIQVPSHSELACLRVRVRAGPVTRHRDGRDCEAHSCPPGSGHFGSCNSENGRRAKFQWPHADHGRGRRYVIRSRTVASATEEINFLRFAAEELFSAPYF